MSLHRRPVRGRRTGLAAAALAVAALTILGASAPALAAKGGGGKPGGGSTGASGSFTLVALDSTDGVPHYGQRITFNVSSSAPRPTVRVDCNQAGTTVYTASAGYYPEYPWSNVLTLTSGAWTGGAADCGATLSSISSKGALTTLATLTFHADA
jgi:hypothetical protein